MNARRGFTLIEILVAVTIVAVLAVIGVVSYSSVNRRSRDAKRKSDLEQVRAALEMYRADSGNYPAVNTSGPFGPISGLTVALGSYIPKMPEDPQTSATLGKFYYYKAKNENPVGSGSYYSYCVCAWLEDAASGKNDCDAADSNPSCNYFLKNP